MAAGLGMSVPGATDLGLGSTLSQQVEGETDEQRRKRLLAQQQQRLLPGSSPLTCGCSPSCRPIAMCTPGSGRKPPR
jgi:hypothetical protein